MIRHYVLRKPSIGERFADTAIRCYATYENQAAVWHAACKHARPPGRSVGGYNSSNTTHLVELCEEKLPTFLSAAKQKSFRPPNPALQFHNRADCSAAITCRNRTGKILVTSGASCPDRHRGSRYPPAGGLLGVKNTNRELITHSPINFLPG